MVETGVGVSLGVHVGTAAARGPLTDGELTEFVRCWQAYVAARHERPPGWFDRLHERRADGTPAVGWWADKWPDVMPTFRVAGDDFGAAARRFCAAVRHAEGRA